MTIWEGKSEIVVSSFATKTRGNVKKFTDCREAPESTKSPPGQAKCITAVRADQNAMERHGLGNRTSSKQRVAVQNV